MIHQQIKRVAQSTIFHHIINYAILGFAVIVGLEAGQRDPELQSLFRIFDYAFLGLFTLEIILRILAEDHPGMFFVLFEIKKVKRGNTTRLKLEFSEHGFWNYFDFILISLSLFGVFAQFFMNPSFIQIGRLFRVFRILRLLEISEHLKLVEERIMSIVPTVFTFAILLLILNYIYAISAMYMFGAHTYATCDFTTVMSTFVTLFQVMTLDNWSDVMHDLQTNSGIYPIVIQFYFVSFVVFTSIIAFNVFVAVMTSQVQQKLEADIEQKVAESQEADASTHDLLRESMEEVVKEVRVLRAEIAALKRNN